MTQAYDAVIVGAGAGGAAVAWRLTAGGMNVLLLEAGPRFDPARDYSQTTTDWERRGFPLKPGSTGAVSYGDLGTLDPADADLHSWNRVTGPVASGPRRRPTRVGYWHVQGVGGTTLHFVGEAHRLHPRSLARASAHGIGADWPLTAADLDPYYTTCETVIGVAGVPTDDGRWSVGAHLQPPHPLSPPARRIAATGAALGMEWRANTRAALSLPRDGRPACNYCGTCARGCPIGDKGSADVTFIRQAEATGRLTILTQAQVLRIVTDASGAASAVIYVQDGRQVEQETPILVLAAGAVQTPRLLLASADARHPEGVANGSGAVGRNFMETLHWTSTGLLPGLKDSHKGLPADAVCWTFNAPDGVPGVAGGCRFTSSTQENWLTGPVAYATRLVDGFGAAFKARMRSDFGSAISVSGTGAVIPDSRSFVDLDPERRDSFGVPNARINSVLTDNSLRLMRFMAGQCRAVLDATGVRDLAEESGAWDQFQSTHVFGTCRMGVDAAASVVDARGRAHDVANLYVADASVFPSTGGGEAPSLTIQALALRTAEAVLATP